MATATRDAGLLATGPDMPRRRGIVSITRSPLARRIVAFNLVAMLSLVAGVMIASPFDTASLRQREADLVREAALITGAFEAQMRHASERGIEADTLDLLKLNMAGEVFVFDAGGRIVASDRAPSAAFPAVLESVPATPISDTVERIIASVAGFARPETVPVAADDVRETLRELGKGLAPTGFALDYLVDAEGGPIVAVSVPIVHEGRVVGTVGLTSGKGEIDHLLRFGREQILQIFLVAVAISIGLSLILASNIANPLADLAAAVEIGRERNTRSITSGRVRIPDLTSRPDEIGRLSGALRGMVAALYDRIEANEQFAADVAHEIKNPLASLRSAIGSLRVVEREDLRTRLLDVIEHDVRRLDRLVSDISNASRLDCELVMDEERRFDLLAMLNGLTTYLGDAAREKGIDFIVSLPSQPIWLDGLESRLAQVFVNLISNATSFCGPGDAIRIWARQRENRVLVVVEDTGPGIPESALGKVFERFYSERPEAQFGNNSGLGLAISKQIVEAHGGVIWAENIQPNDEMPGALPAGARLVVGLPV
ncbi:ATP-binding protein [Palleronia sp. LCG004]|uniref:ATP-binding protein n=1 Tax=Palleronia sp. LCG004 TaxID=3079304 RepID=UPI002942D5B5|nr:ATP-binding protein [Palleronia sp. LCG004]WOI56656.1 ATP-binding protein [Palleronia sp. LCG004]